jgi:hypothetical protein
MEAWQAPKISPHLQGPILLWGGGSPFHATLAAELRAMRAPVVHAPDLEGLIEAVPAQGSPPSVLVLPESRIDPGEFEAMLTELRIRTGSTRLVPIAYGRMPSVKRRLALRNAGVHLALFAPFGRNALRFQINRALSPYANRKPRGDLRVPKEWRTRTYSAGREKRARCYSLSSGGAYLVTPRPWVVGADVALELPLEGKRVRIDGRILYTNAPGSIDRPTLPGGMAVAFRPLPQPVQDAIRADVSRSRFGLVV